MTNPLATADFFALEAGECLDRLELLVRRDDAPPAEDFLRASRVLRGSALMASQQAIARAAGVEGTVTIAAVVDASGQVTGTSVVRSVPLLNQAALDAVKEWQFEPQRVGGRAVPTMVTVNVNFVRS